MAAIDMRERQLTLKLVYYGPPLSGKTTNLVHLHRRVRAGNRGRLMTLDTRDDRTLFFDLLPIFFQASNLSFRLKVYTVPGQPLHEITRRVVLRGVDGVAFVADSQRDAVAANNESYADLLRNLEAAGLEPGAVPIVVQYNKRDLPDIVPAGEIERHGACDEPVVLACALSGEGVLETFFALVDRTWQALDAAVGLERGFGLSRDAFLAALRAHVAGGQEAG